MSDSRVVGGLERLPWLADEPVRKAAPVKRRGSNLTSWAIAAVLLVAALFFWLGSRTALDEAPQATAGRASTTVAVPEPRVVPAPEVQIAPQPEVTPAPQPEIRVVRVPEIRIVSVPAPKVGSADDVAAPATEGAKTTEQASASTAQATAAKAPPAVPLKPWEPRLVAGAAGRIVQVGAFGSVDQAKQGWRYMVRAYPAVAHLPAVVRPDRNSKGRAFYRFRVGTTSQAHSEVLCQRMEKIKLSCAVVGLPWKAKVER
jgi:hypothetical protein